MNIDITTEEERILTACIYMAAREGFYDLPDSRDYTEKILTAFLTKLEYDNDNILRFLDE
jgi:hypothetical protein